MIKLVHVILETEPGRTLHRIVPVLTMGNHSFITSTNEEFSCKSGTRLNGPDGSFGLKAAWRACNHFLIEDSVWAGRLYSAGRVDSRRWDFSELNYLIVLPHEFSRFCFRHGIEHISQVLKIPVDIQRRLSLA